MTNNSLKQCYLDTKLLKAVRSGNCEVVRGLLEKKANPNATERRWTALSCAAGNPSSRIVKMLLEANADPNVCHDVAGTALGTAAQYQSLECCKVLVEGKADCNLASKWGLAINQTANKEIVDYLAANSCAPAPLAPPAPMPILLPSDELTKDVEQAKDEKVEDEKTEHDHSHRHTE